MGKLFSMLWVTHHVNDSIWILSINQIKVKITQKKEGFVLRNLKNVKLRCLWQQLIKKKKHISFVCIRTAYWRTALCIYCEALMSREGQYTVDEVCYICNIHLTSKMLCESSMKNSEGHSQLHPANIGSAHSIGSQQWPPFTLEF